MSKENVEEEEYVPFFYKDYNRATRRAIEKPIWNTARKNSKLAVKKYGSEWTVQQSDTAYFLTAEQAINNIADNFIANAEENNKQSEETNE